MTRAPLTFNGNYSVSADNNETWKGGGIIVNSRKNWQTGRLTALRMTACTSLVRTLNISATGVNLEGLTLVMVLLFSRSLIIKAMYRLFRVDIVSGRPIVVLSDENKLILITSTGVIAEIHLT
ncbi:hypothetical protein OHD50_26570 [Escherichia coli]|nr:hypothetical protein [Escherichia coli]